MAKTQILQVVVDKTTERTLRQKARKEDISLSALIRRAINSFITATAEPVSEKPEQWRQLGPEHDVMIDEQSARAFVK